MQMKAEFVKSLNSQGMVCDGPAPTPLPVVSLELFFDGNNDLGSIGCNLLDHPGIDRFLQVLQSVRDRATVQDVLVEIYEWEGEGWPFSERVYIITSASERKVEQWTRELCPSELGEGWAFGPPTAAPEVRPDFRVVSLWWD